MAAPDLTETRQHAEEAAVAAAEAAAIAADDGEEEENEEDWLATLRPFTPLVGSRAFGRPFTPTSPGGLHGGGLNAGGGLVHFPAGLDVSLLNQRTPGLCLSLFIRPRNRHRQNVSHVMNSACARSRLQVTPVQ
eukprot:SAG31_NODE_6737_length_1905_cov_1.596346_2_plen_134_part_01